MPHAAPAPRTIRALFARTYETIRFRDHLSNADLFSYAEIGSDPTDGDSVIVTDGHENWRCRFVAGAPLPDGCRILGRSIAIVIPE